MRAPCLLYLFTVNFIGLGFGPALVPMISDYILRETAHWQ